MNDLKYPVYTFYNLKASTVSRLMDNGYYYTVLAYNIPYSVPSKQLAQLQGMSRNRLSPLNS